MKFNLALAQINTRLGDVDANLEKHLALVKRGPPAGADLLVFPELSLTGYVLQDLVPAVAHSAQPRTTRSSDPCWRPAASSTWWWVLWKKTAATAFTLPPPISRAAQVVHVHHKVYLPTYGLFDEGRFFAWGDAVSALSIPASGGWAC